ncbi:MAG: mono/diheme cytochrome c family protein/glucose/arabinose dehydrogenase [Verrucomicrobiales bacterium]|jgi:mono/diheme cytochrome c family protein/glucose/arabinose dehydrogenase
MKKSHPFSPLLGIVLALLVGAACPIAAQSIEGYPGKRSYVAGEELTFHVSADFDQFDVEIARIGAQRKVVWSKQGVAGKKHPVPAHASSHGCDWPTAFSLEVPESWPSGCYEAWTKSGDVRGNRMFFVVRSSSPGRDTKILLQFSTNTYNAYNGWGGFSLYTYWGPDNWDKKHAPGDELGRRVTFQRPFGGIDRNWELPFIQWAENNGYLIDYAINSDLEFHPQLLEHYQLVLSVGHDEYWSTPMRDHLEAFIARGGNVAFFSGNVSCWQVRSEDDGNDLVCWKEAFEQDPLYRPEGHPLLSTLWSHHLVKRPENQLTGVGFLRGGFHKSHGQFMDGSGAYKVHRPDHWVFEGTGLTEGKEFGGANSIVGYECDGCEFTIENGRPVPTGRDGTPENFTILATAPARWAEGDLGWYDKALELWKSNEHEHGCMGIYTKPGGGTVFTAATTDWSHGLAAAPGGGSDAAGALGPGHAAGVFKGGTWNVLHDHFVGKVLDEDGKTLPGELTIEFGAAARDQPITNWGKVPQASYVNASAPQGVGNSALMNDMLWSSQGDREQAGVRVRGLPAGTYEVFALLRHFAAPETERFEWAIGADIDRVDGHSFVATGGSRTQWVEASADRPGNYAHAKISIAGPDQSLAMIYDNLDQNYSEIMGFQIAAPGFKIQFDAGGGGTAPDDGHVERITRNVLDRLSGGTSRQTGSTPKERPAIRPASALHGWADWERGEKIFEKIEVPPAPVLSPEEEQATFKLAPGYRAELVAAEPMVANPIFFEFDADGRIWALEYRGYMRDLQGRGEGDPICKLVVLEDSDADGKADKQTVFLDELVMPRSFAFVEGGVLLAEPPNLWFCQDLDGDLRCDKKTKVGTFGAAGNPQHCANGLRRGIDNWLHSADWGRRYQFRDGKLIEEETIHRGQFGVSFDDLGRFFTCHESNAATADFIPAEYLLRHPNLMSLVGRRNADELGVHISIARDAQKVFPIRPTPQITLGGLELRDDGTLRTYTIVAGTCVYRGDQFPLEARGNLFVPEAGGHLIGRLKLDGGLDFKAERFYPDGQELLASTDERFRPVNARTGPDGTLYIADMYHGIIEHVIFMVPWVADQIKARQLEQGNDLGRIWRIVHEGSPIERKSPQLSRATAEELVQTLDHPNGWWRDTAQRLLVDGSKAEAVPLLKKMTRDGETHLGRMHALWALSGMSALDWDIAMAVLDDPHEYVRATALRVIEPLLVAEREEELIDALVEIWLADDNEIVLQQALLALGSLASISDDYFQITNELVQSRPQPLLAIAAMSSLKGRELEFFRYIYEDGKRPRSKTLISDLAALVVMEGDTERIRQLLVIGEEGGDWANVIADAVITVRSEKDTALTLAEEPGLIALLANSDKMNEKEKAMKLRQRLTWPGNTPLRVAQVDLKPLTAEQAQLVELGSVKYAQFCAACHQPHGAGAPGLAPPLAGSEWVEGAPDRLARIVLHGLIGPIKVQDKEWNLHMPGLGGALDDKEIAAILSFTRRAWGNRADPLAEDLVTETRKAFDNRKFPWSALELGGETIANGASAPRIIESKADGSIDLLAKLATTLASKLRYHQDLDIIGPWIMPSDAALWHLQAPADGRYRVHLLHACDDENAGNEFVIETDLSQLRGKVASTGGFDQFKELEFGTVELKKGTNRLLMRPAGELKGELVDLRRIRLIPN